MNIAEFSLSVFEPLVGTQFSVQTSHGPFTLTLAGAREEPRGNLPSYLRAPLFLTFDAPSGLMMAQDNYLVSHPAIGEHVLQIAPIMPNPPGAPLQYGVLFT